MQQKCDILIYNECVMKRYVWIFALLTLFCIQEAGGVPFTTDFETGNLRGWTIVGSAFLGQPVYGDNVKARGIAEGAGMQGSFWIGTYERHYDGPDSGPPGAIQGDAPTGRLVSQPFVIESNRLSFLVGGGASFKTRVELQILVDPIENVYHAVMHASGKNRERMERVVWDLTPYVGKQARLVIVDDSSGRWGHINADDFRFYSENVAATVMEGMVLQPSSGATVIQTNPPPKAATQKPGETAIQPLPRSPAAGSGQSVRPLTRPVTRAPNRPEPVAEPPHSTPVSVTLPDLRGMAYEKAVWRLQRLELFGYVKGKMQAKEAEGTVIRQLPKAGTRVHQGDEVALWLSLGPPPPPPDYSVALKADRTRIEEGDTVVFSVGIAPVFSKKSRYFLFLADDGRPVAASDAPTFRHRFRKSGRYLVKAKVHFPDGQEAWSGPLAIAVVPLAPPASPEPPGPHTSEVPKKPDAWWWAGGALLALITGGGLMGVRRWRAARRGEGEKGVPQGAPKVTYTKISSDGEVSVSKEENPVVLRWSLEALPDRGEQIIEGLEVSVVEGANDAKT